MAEQNKWEEWEWNIPSGDPLHHKQVRDIRKRIYLATIGHYSTQEKTVFEATNPRLDIPVIRFANSWADTLAPYPQGSGLAQGNPSNDLVYDDEGLFPTNCDVSTLFPQYRPGSLTVFFERSFEHSIVGAVLTGSDYEFKFAATTVKQYAIYNQNSCTIKTKLGTANTDIDDAVAEGSAEQFFREEDDFREGTPFLVTDTTSNDGFYRVKSRREDSGFVYVIVDNNNYEQQDLVVEGAGGTAACNPKKNPGDKHGIWGGDWWTLRSGQGNSSASYDGSTDNGKLNDSFALLDDYVYDGPADDLWWTHKDIFHRYLPQSVYPYPSDEEELAAYEYEPSYGPNDGRPGDCHLSQDFNKDWVRTPNPSLFSCWDENCRRYKIVSDTDGSQGSGYEQWSAVFPAKDYMSKQVDPKEQEVPNKFEDSGSTRWRYEGKVKIQKNQITNVDKLGPIDSVLRTGYTTLGGTKVGASSARQYQSNYTIDAGGTNTGNRSTLGTNPTALDNFRNIMINAKYDESLQVMVEHACESQEWAMEADDTYKENWANLYSTTFIRKLPGTYDLWDDSTSYSVDDMVQYELYVYKSRQGSNLDNTPSLGDETWWEPMTVSDLQSINEDIDFIWVPEINSNQTFFPELHDELWGENGSAFEKILKEIGSEYYDWYLDTDTETPYRSARILNEGWLWWNSLDSGEQAAEEAIAGTSGADETIDYYWKVPSVWRRTWKYSCGRVSPTRMRYGNLTNPLFHTYANFATYPASHSSSGGIKGYGHFRMTAEDTSEYYTWNESITPDDQRFILDENRTTEVSSGDVLVDYSVSAPYPTYKVLDISYNSVENKTTFIMDDNFLTDQPTSIYGNTNISLRHDAGYCLIDTDNPSGPSGQTIDVYNKNIKIMLNHCRQVLLKLELKYEDISVGIVDSEQLAPFEELRNFDTVAELQLDLVDVFKGIDPKVEDYSGTSLGVSGIACGTQPAGGGQVRFMFIETEIIRSAIRVSIPASSASSIPFGSGEQKIQVTLECRCAQGAASAQTDPHYIDGELLVDSSSKTTQAPGFKGLVDIVCLSELDNYYGLAELSALDADFITYNSVSKTYEYTYKLENLYEYSIPMSTVSIPGLNFAVCFVSITSTNPAVLFDWDKFNDDIWKRTTERAQYELIDWNGIDEEAPQ